MDARRRASLYAGSQSIGVRASALREVDCKMKTTGELRRLNITYSMAPPDMVPLHAEDVTEKHRQRCRA